MNHCLLEAEVIKAPTLRYTQDKQTPVAEMEVLFEGLRAEDAACQVRVVGWGNLAQDLQNRVKVGQKLLLEGRLRMNTVPRNDGTKEKRAELTLSRLHSLSSNPNKINPGNTPSSNPYKAKDETSPQSSKAEADELIKQPDESVNWNSSPLIPDTDEIPF